MVGLEHEYRVIDGDKKLDFRTVIHSLDLGQPRLDPADPYAYRLGSGAKLTCDKEEAEIATPPIPIEPGFAAAAAGRAARERRWLLSRLSAGVQLDGCSTHISVAVPEGREDAVAKMYTSRFAPGLTLLVDGSSSPGLAIRPRPGRLEICGEFLEGTSLRVAVAFAAGGVAACTEAVASSPQPALPPELVIELLPVVDRYGWYFDARTLVNRIQGRAMQWMTKDGGTVTAGEHLALAWATSRHALGSLAGHEDLAPVSRMVGGDMPLACEATDTPEAEALPPMRAADAVSDLLTPRHRGRFQIAPLMVTWDVIVFVVAASTGRIAFAAIPTEWLEAFLGAADAGLLDEILERYLSADPSGRQLKVRVDALRPGLYDSLPSRVALLAVERSATRVPRELLAQRRPRPSRIRKHFSTAVSGTMRG